MSTDITTVFEQGAWLSSNEFVCLAYKLNNKFVYEFLHKDNLHKKKLKTMLQQIKNYVFISNCPKYINEYSNVDKNILVTTSMKDIDGVTKNKVIYVARDYSEVQEITDYWLK